MLGQARLTGPSGAALDLERKAAGLLAYLALEGGAPRSRLAGYFWPESREETARNNLAQLLRKLRLASGEDLVPGTAGGLLQLQSGLRVDAAEVRETYLLGDHEVFLGRARPLLDGLDYDDCPEFDDWLSAERERWLDWQRVALRDLSAHAEAAGDLTSALDWAEQALRADPVSEGAFVRVMTLQYLGGQRLRALQTFERCRAVLKEEFDVEPLRQTVELARTIAASTAGPPAPLPGPVPALPLSVRRPPQLIGRAEQWRQLQQAHAVGQVTLVTGEPGSGKTRLAVDFGSSLGTAVHLQARPGDQGVPYATLTRFARQLLGAATPEALPGWAQAELAGLLPELTPPVTAPAEGPGDARLRLRQAFLELMRAAAPDAGAYVVDDLQFADEASQEALLHVITNRPQGAFPALLVLARDGELDARTRDHLDGLIETGVLVRCSVGPLPANAVEALLGTLDVPDVQHLAADLTAYTRGNPLFILETLRHIMETDGYLSASLGYFTLPRRVGVLVQQRLKRLSPKALQVAQAAAVLQSDFDLDVISEVLHEPIFSLIPVWDELERTQVIHQGRFSHDIVYESVRGTLPGGVWQALHRSAARTLDRHGAAPARVARHWLEGARPAEAVPFVARAAREAEQRYLLREAAQTYAQLADLLDQQGDQPAAFNALDAQAEVLINLQDVDGVTEVVARLQRSAVTRAQQAAARVRYCFLLFQRGDHDALLRASEEGVAWAREAGDLKSEASLLEGIAFVDIIRGGGTWAREVFTRMLDVGVTLADYELQAKAHEGLGLVIVGDRRQVLEHYRLAEALHEQSGDIRGFAAVSGKRAWLQYHQGDVPGALQTFSHAHRRLADVRQGHESVKLINAWGRSACLLALGQYAAALEIPDLARAASTGTDAGANGWRQVLEVQRGRVLLELGSPHDALAVIGPALGDRDYPQNIRSRGLITLGLALRAAGRAAAAEQAFTEAGGLLTAEKEPYYWIGLHLARSQGLDPAERLAGLEPLLDLARRTHNPHLALAVQVRRAQALMALGQPVTLHDLEGEAQGHGVLSYGEVLLTRYQAARMTASLDLPAHLKALTGWVTSTAREHVPAAHQEGFWASHPAARAVQALEPALVRRTFPRR